jgi:hypothetical protein
VVVTRPSKKLMWKYTGPYKIIEKISDVVYRLELPPTLHVHPVFHISRLKRFHTRPAELQPPSQAEEVPPPPVIVDDHEEYEVENILAKRRFGRVVKYLVKWRGYPIEASTWQSVDDLANAADIVRQFEARRQRSIEDDAHLGGVPLLHALTNAKSDQGNDVNYASSERQVVWNSMINAVTHPSPNMEESRNAMELDGARITKPDVLPDKLWLLLAHSNDTL